MNKTRRARIGGPLLCPVCRRAHAAPNVWTNLVQQHPRLFFRLTVCAMPAWYQQRCPDTEIKKTYFALGRQTLFWALSSESRYHWRSKSTHGMELLLKSFRFRRGIAFQQFPSLSASQVVGGPQTLSTTSYERPAEDRQVAGKGAPSVHLHPQQFVSGVGLSPFFWKASKKHPNRRIQMDPDFFSFVNQRSLRTLTVH